MPTKLKNPCSRPGCPNATPCAVHPPAQRTVVQERAGSTARGYGYAWQKRRAAFLAEHPWCEMCGAPSTEAHHVIQKGMNGPDEEANLRAYCKPCHSRVTMRLSNRRRHGNEMDTRKNH